MDDLILFDDDRQKLEALGHRVEEAMHGLRLRLHPWSVHPTRAGMPLLGYRVLPDQTRVKRSSVARAERLLLKKARRWQAGDLEREAFESSLRATFGHWSHADSWRLRERTLRRLGLLQFDET
jgi:RNA-directed DNA polymerase